MQIRELLEDERGWLAQRLTAAFGSPTIVSAGAVRDAEVGDDGIPIHDEIELSLRLDH